MKIIFLFLLLSLLLVSCSLESKNDVSKKNNSDIENIPETTPLETTAKEIILSKEKAIEIAQGSGNCLVAGEINPGKEANYNENSKTWWIGMDSDKDGCNPACIVNEDRSTEINWRCMGLINE